MSGRGTVHAVAAPAEARARRPRLTTMGAAVAAAVVLAALTSQYAKTYTLAREEARLEQRRRDLVAENARLRDEIERLKTDDRYIEQIARQQLGLVRPGEIELLIVPFEGTVAPPGATPRGGAPALPVRDAGPDVEPPSPPPGMDAVPPPQSPRGIGVWAVGVRDAILRWLHVPHR